MNIWGKMLTALRGGVNEAGEAVVDSQALRILDQEVRDASEELKRSKHSLAEMLAQQKVAAECCKKTRTEIKEYEGYAVKALEQKDEALALEVAEKIADLENKLSDLTASEKSYKDNVNKLRTVIEQTERNINLMKQQVSTVKATESVQRAQMAVAERYSGSESKLMTAMDSLERIKEKQELRDAQMKAAEELSSLPGDESLKDKLKAAGITQDEKNAEDVLEKLRAKASKKK